MTFGSPRGGPRAGETAGYRPRARASPQPFRNFRRRFQESSTGYPLLDCWRTAAVPPGGRPRHSFRTPAAVPKGKLRISGACLRAPRSRSQKRAGPLDFLRWPLQAGRCFTSLGGYYQRQEPDIRCLTLASPPVVWASPPPLRHSRRRFPKSSSGYPVLDFRPGPEFPRGRRKDAAADATFPGPVLDTEGGCQRGPWRMPGFISDATGGILAPRAVSKGTRLRDFKKALLKAPEKVPPKWWYRFAFPRKGTTNMVGLTCRFAVFFNWPHVVFRRFQIKPSIKRQISLRAFEQY